MSCTYSGLILESVFQSGITKSSEPIFQFDRYIFALNTRDLLSIGKLENESVLHLLHNKLWTNSDTTNVAQIINEKYDYAEIEKTPETRFYNVEEFGVDRIVGIDILKWPQDLFIFNTITGEYNSICAKFDDFTASDNLIYTRSDFGKTISCFDETLNELWSLKLDPTHYNINNKPYLVGDMLVVFHSNTVMGINTKSQKIVWDYQFNSEYLPTSATFFEDLIYVVDNAELYVIDPLTGEVLVKKDSGFQKHKKTDLGSELNKIRMYPCKGGLCVYSEYDCSVKIFTPDGNIELCNMIVPNYYPHDIDTVPLIHNGYVYWQVRNGFAYSDLGIMIIGPTREGDTAGQIEIAKRPEVRIYANPSLDEFHSQDVFLETGSVEDASRNLSLVIQELQYSTGFIPIYNIKKGAADRKHNGEIKLILDGDRFTGDDENELYLVVDKLNELSEDFLTGDRKSKLNIKISFIPRADWKESGDQLDWPAIRDSEIPISS